MKKTVLILGLLAVSAASVGVFAATSATQEPSLIRSRPVVRDVQAALFERGYDPGPVDGVMGPLTREALRQFQAANGLAADGQLNDATLEKLGVELPLKEGDDRRDRGLVGEVGSAVGSAGKAVAGAAATGGKAVAGAAATGGTAAAQGAATAGKATASGATTAGKATGRAATTGGEAVAEGASTGGKATASAAKTAVSGVGKAAGGAKRILFGSDPDKELKERVEKALKRDPGVNPDHVEVQAVDGIVTLSFSAGSSNEWNRAVAVAKRVEGVERVFVRKP